MLFPQGSILGPLLFIIYIKDFPFGINSHTKPVLFALLITAKGLNGFQMKPTSIPNHISKWIAVNVLSLNVDNITVIKFKLNHLQDDTFQILSQDKEIKEVTNIKFVGLGLDKHKEWKTHIEQIRQKMSSVCCVIRLMYHFGNINTIKMMYFACVHLIMKYRIIFWGNSIDSKRVSQLQKRVVRIMRGAKSSILYKPLLRALEILTLSSQYELSLMTFLIHNLDYLTFNFQCTVIIQERKCSYIDK